MRPRLAFQSPTPPLSTEINRKYTNPSSIGLSTSHNAPSALSKWFAFWVARESSYANRRRFQNSRRYGPSGGRLALCGS